MKRYSNFHANKSHYILIENDRKNGYLSVSQPNSFGTSGFRVKVVPTFL